MFFFSIFFFFLKRKVWFSSLSRCWCIQKNGGPEEKKMTFGAITA